MTESDDFDGSDGGGASAVHAVRGAIAFLTRIPVPGRSEADFEAFRRSPWTMPVVGALVGAVAGAAFLLALPWPTVAAIYLLAVYLSTGVTHADGLADLGDAIAAHDPERRREALRDAGVGVGGALALVVTLFVLALGAVGLASPPSMRPLDAVRIVLAAEVGAKLGMALLVALGTAAHEGLGSQLVDVSDARALIPAALLASPVVLGPPFQVATGLPIGVHTPALAALLAGPAVAVVLLVRTRSWLGGVSGDVIGAANELGRALALHAGVIAWAIA